MKELVTCSKSLKNKKESMDESGLSKNHSKSIRYRLRVQQNKEADSAIKEYKKKEFNAS